MILHNYTWAASSTQQWDTSDNEDNFHRNFSKLQELGLDSWSISYNFNSHGFRGPEFEKVDIITLGCSFTMGCGVAEHQTWPSQLGSILGATVANLGHSGSSNDTAFRFAKHYIPQLNPRIVCWLQTDRHRLEIIDDTQKIVTNLMANYQLNSYYSKDNFVRQWFLSDSNQQINLEKNTLAVRQLCEMNDIKFYVIGRDEIENLDLGRDLMHPGPKSYKHIAEQFARQFDINR